MERSGKSIHCFTFGEETKYPCLSMCLEKGTTPSQLLDHHDSHGEGSKKIHSRAVFGEEMKAYSKTCTIAWRWGFQIGECFECLQSSFQISKTVWEHVDVFWDCQCHSLALWESLLSMLVIFHPLPQGVWTSATSDYSFPSTILKMASSKAHKRWISIFR